MPNSVGIIDQDYSGPEDEILLQVQNFTDQPILVERGERIAQGTFVVIERATWHEVSQIQQQSRGGIGSTGGYGGQA